MKNILLHGLGQSPASWNGTVKAADGKFDILCPDLAEWLRGREPCYTALYQALEKYCGQFSEPLNLCGLSLGGILALQYGIEHADRVNSMVLIGTRYTMPQGLLKLQNMVFRAMPDFAFKNTGFGKMDFISLSKSMMDLDFSRDLKKIRCPVLVMCGEKDKANKKASLQLKEQIPHAEISIIANAGHEVNLDAPAELGRELELFFGR